MPALTISIQHLDSAGKDFVFTLDQAWLDEALTDTGVRGDASAGDGRVEVHAQMNGREVLVHGTASASFFVECGRCLKSLPLKVSCDIAALFAPGTAPVRKPGAADDDELDDIDPDAPDREYFTGDSLAIDALVRDYLLLELPMQTYCDAGWDCANLDVPEHMRSASGISTAKDFDEGAIDPRLIPLMKLAKGEREKE